MKSRAFFPVIEICLLFLRISLLASISHDLLASVESEPNNDRVSGNAVQIGETIYGQLASDQDKDWFLVNGNSPDELPLSFKCNQAGYYYYYYNPYYYTVTAYNGTGDQVASYLIPLSFCTQNFGSPYVMHLNGSENGVKSLSIGVKTDPSSCPYCYYDGFANYTSEYSLSFLTQDTIPAPTVMSKTGTVTLGSWIRKDIRQHADQVQLKLKGCKDENVPTIIVIKGRGLKLSEITPETHVALEIGNWRCDASGTWRNVPDNKGNLFKTRKQK